MSTPSESLAEELSEKEALPPHTSEIGTLKKLPDHDTEWLGSSSGVYFVNTVRRAFSAAFSATTSETQSYPASEDLLAGGEHIYQALSRGLWLKRLGIFHPGAWLVNLS